MIRHEGLGHEVGARRRERVPALAREPVGSNARPVRPPRAIATGDVVRRHVAGDVIGGFRGRDVAAGTSDHHREFSLPVDTHHPRRNLDVVESAAQGRGRLAEQVGFGLTLLRLVVLRRIDRRHAVAERLAHAGHVLAIIRGGVEHLGRTHDRRQDTQARCRVSRVADVRTVGAHRPQARRHGRDRVEVARPVGEQREQIRTFRTRARRGGGRVPQGAEVVAGGLVVEHQRAEAPRAAGISREFETIAHR